MTFEGENGVLDFDGDFAITKRAVSFFNSKIQGDFSINFEVANNSINRQVLGYDGPQMLNQVAFTRQPFTLMRNGNPFSKGYIVIQTDTGPTLTCYFISGNSNWINLLQGLITELDYSGVTNAVNYITQLTSTNIQALRSATSGIIFPMVDWCYDLRKGDNSWFADDLLDVSGDATHTFLEWYPCFYLHSLVSEIMKQNGLKISGSVLDNKIYQTMVLTPVNGEIKRKQIYKITTGYGTAQSNATGSEVQYTNLTEAADPYELLSSGTFTMPQSAKVNITLNVTQFSAAGATQALIRLKKNGVTQTTLTADTAAVDNPSTVFEASGVTGDIFQVFFVRVGGAGSVTVTLNLKFDIPTTITFNDYIDPANFLPALTSLEIIKFIINYFGCSVYFDEYSNTLSVNQIEKFKAEDAADWSEYLDMSAPIKTVYTIDGAANNYMRLAVSEDTEIKSYNKANTIKYGEGNIQTGNTLKDKADILKIPFAASEFGLSENESWLSNIPLIKLSDGGDPILFISTSDDGTGQALLQWDTDIDSLITGQVCRIVDDSRGDLGMWVCEGSAMLGPGQAEAAFYGFNYSGATSTGRIYVQQFEVNQIQPRILIVKPSTEIGDFGVDVEYLLHSPIGSTTGYTSTAFAYFARPSIGEPIDSDTGNLAFDNPDLDGYTRPTQKQLSFGKISNMIGNPAHNVQMLLPESVYHAWQFAGFITLKTKDLTGYFWVDSINQYRDGDTKVEVKLLML